MKTRYLPLVALISATVCSSPAIAASQAYVTDSNGNMVKDSYGSCVRSIDWSADIAIDSCENPVKTDVAKSVTKATPVSTVSMPAPTLVAPVSGDIDGKSQSAYAIDSEGRIVRDGYGYCVRTIDWTKDTAIAKCEGWEEPKPAIVAKPKPVVTPVVSVVVEEVVVVEDKVPAAFRGFFESNKADLKTGAMDKLNAYSEYMKRNENTNVKVTGHTDSTGNEAYNQMLSEKRANAVKSYLENTGIAAERIEAQGLGETQPITTNKTKEGRAENRRVELEIIK